jgi:AcrR family transcriptional regulator
VKVAKTKSARRPPRSPGRRKASLNGDGVTKTHIMDVAEEMFANVGYLGASMRVIAEAANVTQALINYYFGSKQQLFEEVFKRRASVLTERYAELLDDLLARKERPPTVRELVHAFVAPQFEMRQQEPGGRNFIRIQARLHNEPEALAFSLRRKTYDKVTKRYIAAFEQALPNVSTADVSWRVVFLIGTFLYMLSDVDRLDDLSGGRFHTGDDDELIMRMVQFMVGGMETSSTKLG